MRRIASVFRSKDKERTVVPLAPTPPPVPSLTSELGSSASSNGSALHTPNDDLVLTRTATRSKSWTAWLGKKSGTIKRRPPDQDTPLDQGWVDPVPDRRMKQPTLILHAPPTPKSLPQPPKVDIHIDSDEDASSLGSDDAEAASHSAPALHPPITPTSVAQSRKNLEILIQNSLVPPLATSTPFSHLPGLPMYPRSSNPPQSLPARQTMQSVMHRSLLLRRLQPDVSTLSVAQQQLDRSILPLASRPPPTPVDPPPPLQWFNDRALPAAMTLSPSSSGLRRWMARPCFEERIAVWVPLNGVVACQPVTGSSCAVADLEYSAALDAMIGFGLAPVEEEASSPVAVAPVPTTQQPQPAAAAVRNTAYHAIPSPLRNSALKPKSAPKSPISETPPSSATSPDFLAPPTPPAAPAPTVSRVRFVEDDKDNVIPLGYTLRLKKKREEKAKFLREEQERRAHEEERAKQEAERLKREQERNQWEEEKRAWEKEQRAMEEERKRRAYAEEVVAARLRREQQRAGGGYGAGSSDTNLLAPSSSTTSLRDERNKQDSGRYSRPLHDRRRQASEPMVQLATPSSSPHTSSPGSSRPPSDTGHHQAGSLRGSSSRPPSVHTSSSEDARQHTKAAKRSSMASLPGQMPSNQFDPYSTWFASNPTLMVPPVPPVPMYAMDMPLLPPTPPFMLQQYPRPRSQNSQNSASPSRSSPSESPSRQRLPSSGSSERVNVQQQPRSSSSSRRPSNASASSLVRPVAPPSHQRRNSDDVRRASLPPPKDPQQDRGRSQPNSLRSHSSTSLSRGRPPMPSSYQPPASNSTPWSAPPLAMSYSQQQLSPAAIINGYGQRAPPQASRRQTTIS